LGADPLLFLLVDRCEAGTPLDSDVPVREYAFDGRVTRALALARAARDILAFRPALVYARYDLYYPVFEVVARRSPLVFELNTDDRVEYSFYSRRRHIYNRLTRNRALGLAAGFGFVTSELACSPSFPARTPRVVVGNSIDLASVVPVDPVWHEAPLVGIAGSLSQPWQGIDILLAAARLRPTWAYELVGQPSTLDLPPNVRVLDPVPRGQLGEILARWDIGIGPLALYRVGLRESSSLKVLEYLAHGLPVVMASHMDLPQDTREYVRWLAAPQSASAVVDAVEELWGATRGRRVPRAAVADIDVAVRERARLDFLATLI
jgi:glycosyltransferase involved in cell wall biosynthesis